MAFSQKIKQSIIWFWQTKKRYLEFRTLLSEDNKNGQKNKTYGKSNKEFFNKQV
jgi:hypothetical protein